MMTQYPYRDAQTGEFVSQEYAEAHPDVTVKEAVESPPDILALEARIQQLEEALRDIRAAISVARNANRAYEVGFCFDQIEATIKRELKAPTPDTSPLWEVLAYACRVGEFTLVIETQREESSFLAEHGYLRKAVKALTPELRALIEARGGQA